MEGNNPANSNAAALAGGVNLSASPTDAEAQVNNEERWERWEQKSQMAAAEQSIPATARDVRPVARPAARDT